MTSEQEAAIAAFFESVARLEELKIVRSSRFLGDIGEFICSEAFEMDLAPQLRQRGHDGMSGSDRVQIKFNNSTKGNNINVGNPKDYEILVVVIGPRSKLREKDHEPSEFRLYRYTKAEVLSWRGSSGSFYCAKARLAACESKHNVARSAVEPK
jgi:hypothetical protein